MACCFSCPIIIFYYIFISAIDNFFFTEYRLKMRNILLFPNQFAAFQILYIGFFFQRQPEPLLVKNPNNLVAFYTI